MVVLSGCAGEVDSGATFDAAVGLGAGADAGMWGQAGYMQQPVAGMSGSSAGAGGAPTVKPPVGGDPKPIDAGADAGTGTDPDAGTPDAGDTEPKGPPSVRFIGRTDTRQAGVVRMEWSGSGIVFRFLGTHAAVTLDDSGGYFTRLIDGHQEDTLVTMGGERTYDVALGLADGTHEVELYRRTEASFGETRFIDVDLGADGMLLAPPVRQTRRIELIGDSITCGYGDEGADETCPFEAKTENHYLTYGAITARALDAELTTIAWSGKGVIYNYDQDKNQPMPTLYDRGVPTDGQSKWDFSQPEPSVVVINLGTNDFSTGDDPSETVFSDAYSDFLVRLRDYYPDAWIVCLAPTLLSGDDLTTAEGYITSVVSERNAQGDDHVVSHILEFTQTGLGCGWHPSLATHASMADALTAKLRSLLGW